MISISTTLSRFRPLLRFSIVKCSLNFRYAASIPNLFNIDPFSVVASMSKSDPENLRLFHDRMHLYAINGNWTGIMRFSAEIKELGYELDAPCFNSIIFCSESQYVLFIYHLQF